MTPAMPTEQDLRHMPRHRVHVTVDVKPLKTQDVDNILFGQGYEDLNYNSLSMSRPRHGMDRCETLDLSLSGLRVKGLDLKPGTAAMLDLHLPEDKVVVKALVEVVWVRQTEESDAEAGLRFAAIQEHGSKRVAEFLRVAN